MIKNTYCKCGLNANQLENRNTLDKDGIEIQLLEDFINTPLSINDYMDIVKDNIDSIKVIHVPLKEKVEIVEIQSLNNIKKQNIFDRVCLLAQKISEINGSNVIIVVHNRWDLSEYIKHNDSFIQIKDFLAKVLNKYPLIKIGIENVIPYIPGEVGFSNGCLPNYVDFINDLRDCLQTNRIGSVLDTCHALVTMRFFELTITTENINFAVSLEDYFKNNTDICFLVHLCDVNRLGFTKASHGITFTYKSIYLLEEINNLYDKYIDNTPVTIEVKEDDYMNCVNYSKTKNLIRSIQSCIVMV